MKHYQWVKDEIEKLLAGRVIWGSWSSWSAPIIVVLNEDGGKGLVIDFTTLNKVTRKCVWPMPNVEDIFFLVKWCKIFFNIGRLSRISPYSFGRIPNSYDFIHLTIWQVWIYQSTFWICTVPGYFEKLMTRILNNLNFTIAYLNNIIFSRTVAEHLDHIKQVFEKLRSTKLTMKLSKCLFFTKITQYLEHILSTKGIRLLPSKTRAIKNMHPWKTPKQVCTFVGLVRYYRKFIRNFAKIAKPLTLLTHQEAKFEWTPTHHNVFLTLKESVILAPMLGYPDPSKHYIVYTDTSYDACG